MHKGPPGYLLAAATVPPPRYQAGNPLKSSALAGGPGRRKKSEGRMQKPKGVARGHSSALTRWARAGSVAVSGLAVSGKRAVGQLVFWPEPAGLASASDVHAARKRLPSRGRESMLAARVVLWETRNMESQPDSAGTNRTGHPAHSWSKGDAGPRFGGALRC